MIQSKTLGFYSQSFLQLALVFIKSFYKNLTTLMLKPHHVNICKKTYWQKILNGPAHCLKLSFNKEGAPKKGI
jgi:hypothetical protein